MPIAPDKKPISFSFNNTERCQSRCITCNGWKTPADVMNQELTLEEWKKILERLYGDGYICENCGEEYFFENTFNECKACGKELQKPIFLQSDKNIPLFNGLTVFANELFATENHYEVFKVVVTKYDKRYGLENRTRNDVVLRLSNGEERTFSRGEVFPIFLDSEIEVENKKIRFV